MVRNIVILPILFFFSIQVQGQQIVKPDKLNFENIKFNSVTKNLIYRNLSENSDTMFMKKIINYWFDNKVKTDGFDGSLEIIIKNIETKNKKGGLFQVFNQFNYRISS